MRKKMRPMKPKAAIMGMPMAAARAARADEIKQMKPKELLLEEEKPYAKLLKKGKGKKRGH